MSLRSTLKNNKLTWYVAQYLRLIIRIMVMIKNRIKLCTVQRSDKSLLKEMYPKIREMFDLNLKLKNTGGFPYYYHGKNVLGYSGMSFMEKDGVNVGMSEGKIMSGDNTLNIVQLKTDLDHNFQTLFDKYRPNYIVDFGTNCGGTAVYFYQKMQQYCDEPKVMSVDITDKGFETCRPFHDHYKSEEKIKFLLDKSSLDRVEEVKEFLKNRKEDKTVMFSYDDDHSYEHTYAEIKAYAPLLKKGDLILMQDTWNQGLFTHETSPMLAVYRFLKENDEYEQDMDLNRKMILPCNYIYGIITKK